MDEWVSLCPELPEEGQLVRVNTGGPFIELAIYRDKKFNFVKLLPVDQTTYMHAKDALAWVEFGHDRFILKDDKDG